MRPCETTGCAALVFGYRRFCGPCARKRNAVATRTARATPRPRHARECAADIDAQLVRHAAVRKQARRFVLTDHEAWCRAGISSVYGGDQ